MILNASAERERHRPTRARTFVTVGRIALDGGNVERARQIVEHGVEQGLDALFLNAEPQTTARSHRQRALRISFLSIAVSGSVPSR